MVPVRTPSWTQKLFPDLVWKVEGVEKSLYLTFDDGPIPEVTPWVLDLLAEYSAKASFFCIGDNVDKHPDIYKRIQEEGHQIGHHTQNHYNAWKHPDRDYYRNVLEGSKRAESTLFRFKVILWSVLSKDYDKKVSPQQCLENVLQCESGDIIVFHDSKKAKKNLEYALPGFLAYYQKLGFSFKALPLSF